MQGTTRAMATKRIEEEKQAAEDQERAHLQKNSVEDDEELQEMLKICSGL